MAALLEAEAPIECVSLVLGGCGFIGSHVAAELKRLGRYVIVVDQKPCQYTFTPPPDHTMLQDLRNFDNCEAAFELASTHLARLRRESEDVINKRNLQLWVYHFAADMGGMGYIENNSSIIVDNNTTITQNVVRSCRSHGVSRLFFASSACVYPVHMQDDSSRVTQLSEDMAWPANPQDGYGLEKLYGEKTAEYASGDLQIRIARFHNVYGPKGTWIGGREKAPAAMLRKAICKHFLDAENGSKAICKHFLDAENGSKGGDICVETSSKCSSDTDNSIEIWGNGQQIRSFLFIDDAVRGVLALMQSDVSEPLNIGSEEAVSIQALAETAAKLLELQVNPSLFTYNPAGPQGVGSRNSDNKLVAARLKWEPRISLHEGLEITKTWLLEDVFPKLRSALHTNVADNNLWYTFLRAGLKSKFGEQVPRHSLASSMMMQPKHSSTPATIQSLRRFGILLPVTSRNLGVGVYHNLRTLLASLQKTMHPDTETAWCFDIFFGVDDGDKICEPAALRELVRNCLPMAWSLGTVTAHTTTFTYQPGSVCKIWADLAYTAFSAGCDVMALLGDDVELLSEGWADDIWSAFTTIQGSTGLPFGFGCVSFADDAFPGFPTFPVLHKLHFSVFAGRIFPDIFKNQDADPFLFQVYRAFGAAKLLPDVRLRNGVGGAGDARYAKSPAKGWSGDLLKHARSEAARWLHFKHPTMVPTQTTLTLDVVVPTFRANEEVLQAILNLQVPPFVSTQFNIIFDNPDNTEAESLRRRLEYKYRGDPFVRIRSNKVNSGASVARNRGLDESCADWVLFLDDDVIPRSNLLVEYAKAIRSHPNATGFIGLSVLPDAQTARQGGVHLAGVSFFWGAAAVFPDATELPWGVTANLCVRRMSGLCFDVSGAFPKTGGGEDIDFCLRARQAWQKECPAGEGFVAVPSAVINHPWWDNGIPKYSHFSGWSRGDGYLIPLYPHLTYLNLPNMVETLLLCVVMNLIASLLCVCQVSVPRFAEPWSIFVFSLLLIGACVVADFAYDWHHRREGELAKKVVRLHGLALVGAVLHGIAIRFWSEVGRQAGHFSRGELHLCRRFNWFGTFRPEVVANERRRELARWVLRGSLLLVLLAIRWG